MTDFPPAGTVSPAPMPLQPQHFAPPPPARRGRLGTWILAILLLGSILANLVLLASLGAGLISAPQKLRATTLENPRAKYAVAVIRVEGVITDEPIGGWGARGTDTLFLKEQVDQALADDTVKAVVLKVDSPGGSASASDNMLHELYRIRQTDKPLIVHMGGLAASGGYYVSMAGEKIYAQPTCITGSIGVLGQFMTVEGLFKDILHIDVHTIKSGPYKDVGNPFRQLTEQEQAYLHDTLIIPMYNRFVDMVVAGRKDLSADRIRQLADGRIFTAPQAVENGLIDEIGFFEDAVKEAMKRASLDEARLVEYRRQLGLFDLLTMSAEGANKPFLQVTPDTINAWSTPRVMLLWRP